MVSFRRLFEIRTGEWRRLLLLYALVFMLNASVVWGRAVSESLFLTRVGIQFLPFMFIADAVLTIVTVTVYGAFVDRLSNTFLMVAIAVLGAVVLVGSRIILEFSSLGFIFTLLFLLERVLRAVISIHAWTYIADFYDTRTAKRHYPLLGSASRTSGILAGLLITPITLLFQVENLVVAWLGALLASAALAWITPRTVAIVTAAEEEESDTAGFTDNLRDGFRFVTSSAFLRFMAGAAVIGTILLYILDYQSQTIFVAAEQLDTAEKLAAFYGLLSVVGNVLILPIQMFLLSRLVNRIGVGNANLIFPGLSALAYGLLIGVGTLPAAAFARINTDTLRSAFRTPIDSLLYNAVPSAIKGRARAFINGLLLPTGALIAGLILLAATQNILSPQVLLVLGAFTATAYAVMALGARAQYGNSLASLLSDDEFSLFSMSATLPDQADPATLRLLRQRLDESEDSNMTVFLLEILDGFEGPEAISTIRDIALERGPIVRAGATRLLADSIDLPEVRALCLDGLQHDDVGVRRASASVLARAADATQDEALLNAFLAALDEPDTEVRAAAIPPLIASGDFYYLAPAVEVLSGWLGETSDTQTRVRGLQVLADTGSERLLRTLVRYLNDPAPPVRRQAVGLIHDLAAQSPLPEVKQLGLETLSSLLTDDDQTVQLAAVHGLGHFKSLEASRVLLVALGDPRFEVRRQAAQAILPGLESELEAALDSQDHYLAESAVFILAGENQARARRQIATIMETLVTNAYRLHSHRLALQAFDNPGADLLQSTLNERVDHYLDRTFWLLSALSDEEEARNIRRSLRSQDPVTRANAAETFESLTTPHLSRLVTPLFEDVPLAELVDTGRESLDLEAPTEWQVAQLAWPDLDVEDTLWDSTTFPADHWPVMRLLLDGKDRTREEIAQALEASSPAEPSALDGALHALVEDRWLDPPGDDHPDTYRVSVHRMGGTYAKTMLATMTDHDLADVYRDDWLQAITIYALLETITRTTQSDAESPLTANILREALQATLNDQDTTPLVDETVRLALTRLDTDGHASRDAVEEQMLTTIEKVVFLKQVPFFQAMSTDQLRVFASISEEASYAEGEQIITQGERGDTLYVIITGQVAVQTRTQKRRGGEDITRLATLEPREYFAEMSIFDNLPYSADVVALQPTDLLLVRQRPLLALIQHQPALATGLLRVLSMRLRKANKVIAERSEARPKELVDLFDKLG